MDFFSYISEVQDKALWNYIDKKCFCLTGIAGSTQAQREKSNTKFYKIMIEPMKNQNVPL